METTYTVNGHRIIATVQGDPQKPPVFFVHGWMSHRGVWRQTLPALEEKYHCIALDLLGFGNSEKPDDGDYSIQMQGRRIIAIADALGFQKFSLVGHSMGGQIAMCIASMLAPERVEKLVSVAGVVTGQLSELVEKNIYPLVRFGHKRPWVYRLSRAMMNNRLYVNWAFRPWFYDIRQMPLREFTIARSFALRAQNRAIRAEEALRYFILTGKRMDARLRLGQIIALRFAPDEEFVTLGHRAVEEKLKATENKKDVRQWRDDRHRV